MGPDLFISTSANDREAVTLLNDLFHEAAGQGVSDIHFQEQESLCRHLFNSVDAMVRAYQAEVEAQGALK